MQSGEQTRVAKGCRGSFIDKRNALRSRAMIYEGGRGKEESRKTRKSRSGTTQKTSSNFQTLSLTCMMGEKVKRGPESRAQSSLFFFFLFQIEISSGGMGGERKNFFYFSLFSPPSSQSTFLHFTCKSADHISTQEEENLLCTSEFRSGEERHHLPTACPRRHPETRSTGAAEAGAAGTGTSAASASCCGDVHCPQQRKTARASSSHSCGPMGGSVAIRRHSGGPRSSRRRRCCRVTPIALFHLSPFLL